MGSDRGGLNDRISENSIASTLAQYRGKIAQGGSTNIPGIGKLDVELYDHDPDAYVNKVVRELSTKDRIKLGHKVLKVAKNNPNAEPIVGGAGKAATGVYILGSVLDGIFSRGGSIGKDIKQVAGFFIALNFLKDSLKLFYPLTLMIVYGFWFIFLFIGGFSGQTLYKGLLMLFLLKLIPMVWGVTDMVTSELMKLFYPNLSGLEWILSSIDALVIHIASIFFYLSVPGLMMYIFMLAGSPNLTPIADGVKSDGSTLINRIRSGMNKR